MAANNDTAPVSALVPSASLRNRRTFALGAEAGLVAALAMLLTFGLLRLLLGIPTPPEAIPDRAAPLLPIPVFFGLFERFGGYNGLKQIGVLSITGGMLLVGVLLGVLYAAWRARTDTGATPRRRRLSPDALLVIALAVVWIGSLLIVLPVLPTNFRGLSPTPATSLFILGWLLAYSVFGAVLALVYGALVAGATPREAAGSPLGRRALLATAGGAILALGVGAVMRTLTERATFGYDGVQYRGTNLTPITPNDRFYSVTKNVVDPAPEVGQWRLEVGGMVSQGRTYTFDQLRALPANDQETTLMCISNGIDGGLMSNAVWRGVPLRALIEASGPQAGAVEVILKGADGYTDTIAFAKAMDPTTMVVYSMNGEPLPQKHGGPARVIVPGLYGEKQVKWVTGLEVVPYDAKGFYETQGWGPNFAIQPRARIDAPDFATPAQANTAVAVRGMAYGGDKGVSRVEFSGDNGQTWQPAQITYPGTRLSWAFWSAEWRPAAPGEYHLTARCTDGTGQVQTAEVRDIVAEGARGYHRITARVV